jgi:hypothetical protein
MKDRRAVRGTLVRGVSIELVVEDGTDRSVGKRADLDGARGGGFQPCDTERRASRRMPRQDRNPCSGWGLCSRIRSHNAAVAGPRRAASLRMRPMVQSA